MKKSSDWRISLIITTYHKDREMAKLTERCIASLNTRGIDEIIVVDDASPFELVIPGVNQIWREKNGGFPKCSNTGWKAATGDILILSNNDIEYTEQGFDISSVRMSDSDGNETEDKITEGDRFGSLWAQKREVYEALGGFDESFDKGTFEDLDYHKRAEAAGFRIGKNHSVVVKHVGRATMDKLYPDRRDFYEGRIHYEQKYGMVE